MDKPPTGTTGNGILAFAAIVNAGASVLLWWTTSGYVETTAKMFSASQMPLVVFDRFNNSYAMDEGGHETGFVTQAIFKNASSGPAYNVILEWDAVLGGKRLKENEPMPKTPLIMAPQSTHGFGRLALPEADVRGLQSGSMALTISLDAHYDDANGRAYHYHASAEYRPNPGPEQLFHPEANFVWFGTEEWCKDSNGKQCAP
jgi:hypothetical protein